MTTEPGWINRQFARIERDSATWPEWMKREVNLKAHGQKLSISRDLLEDAARDGDPFSAAVLQAAKPRLRWRHAGNGWEIGPRNPRNPCNPIGTVFYPEKKVATLTDVALMPIAEGKGMLP